MIMLGTFVNFLAVVIGGILGSLIREGLKENYKEIVMQAIPLAVIFIGISGALKGLLAPGAEPLLFIISLVIGGIIGEALGIERRLESFGESIQKRFIKGESRFAEGFVSASLIFCVGSMAILGSLDSGIRNNHDILYAKSMLDGTFSVIYAATLGIGVAFSAIPVLVYQGSITIMAQHIAPYLTADMIREISIVGGILIFCIGISMLNIRKIKTGNLLPAMIIPVIYYLLKDPVISLFL